MFPGARPSRGRLFVVTLAAVVVLTATLVLPFVSSASSSILGGRAGPTADSANVPEVPHSSSSSLVAAAAGTSATPSGGDPLTFGIVANVTLPAGSLTDGVTADSSNGNVYVTDSQSNVAYVIDGTTQKVLTSVHVGPNPTGAVYDSVNSEVYVANFFGDDVRAINTVNNIVVANITVGGSPVGLACDSLNGNIYVTQQSGNSVSVISGSGGTLNTVIKTIGVGTHPVAVTFDSAMNELFVANFGSSNVSIIDAATNTVTGSVTVGSTPLGVAYDSGNGDIYVTNDQSNNTTVISGTTQKVVTSVKVGESPVGVAYDPVHSVVAVVAQLGGKVSFISSATNVIVGNVSLGKLPVEVAFDPVNNYDYVTSANSSNVSVLSTPLMSPYSVTFNEAGLPAATSWSVTLAGTTEHSATSSIVFSEVNGSYAYSVGSVPGFIASPTGGTALVAGFPLVFDVTFTPFTYPVTFHEVGLPSGTQWSVTFNVTLASSTTSNVTFSAPNGTYPFAVTQVTGFTVGPGSGDVTVDGSAAVQAVSFVRVGVPTYSVTFSETGLATNTSWEVDLNGSPSSSSNTSVTFYNMPNGTYPYKVVAVIGYSESPTTGNVTVKGASQTVPLTFTSTTSPSSTPSSSSSIWLYIIVGVIIAAVVIGLVVLLARRRKPPTATTAPSQSNPSGTPPTPPAS